MQFFSNHQEPKENKIGITSLLSNITTKSYSHKGGWTRILKCQLEHLGYKNVKILDNKDSLLDFNTIIFDLGAEFSGTLNMFGGLDEKVYKRLKELDQFPGKIYSWRHALPKLSECLKSRGSNASTCAGFKAEPSDFVDVITAKLSFVAIFDHVYPTDKLLIGDSHTASVWDPTYMIERRDGRTLDGMLEHKTLEKYIQKFSESAQGIKIKELMIHASSIDIRHHWGRSEDPVLTAKCAATKLLNQVHALGVDALFVHSMGIEDESRDLPKTGYFKGTPFYGDWNTRNEMRNAFNGVLDVACSTRDGWSTIRFPDYFFDETGKLKFDVMERPQSVHISPEHYRTDLDTGKVRW